MCYHKLYVFLGCGHAVFGALVKPCASFVDSDLLLAEDSSCNLPVSVPTNRFLIRRAKHLYHFNVCPRIERHPLHTLRCNSLCANCLKARTRMLAELDIDDRARAAWSVSAAKRRDDQHVEPLAWANEPWSEELITNENDTCDGDELNHKENSGIFNDRRKNTGSLSGSRAPMSKSGILPFQTDSTKEFVTRKEVFSSVNNREQIPTPLICIHQSRDGDGEQTQVDHGKIRTMCQTTKSAHKVGETISQFEEQAAVDRVSVVKVRPLAGHGRLDPVYISNERNMGHQVLDGNQELCPPTLQGTKSLPPPRKLLYDDDYKQLEISATLNVVPVGEPALVAWHNVQLSSLT